MKLQELVRHNMNNTDNELMVLIKTKDLIDYSLTMTDNTKRYPKKARFTFVNRIQDLVLNIYKNISKTNELPINKRKSMQIDILSDTNVLLFLIELSLKRNYISERQCEIWTKKALDVKYLTAAWMKKTK